MTNKTVMYFVKETPCDDIEDDEMVVEKIEYNRWKVNKVLLLFTASFIMYLIGLAYSMYVHENEPCYTIFNCGFRMRNDYGFLTMSTILLEGAIAVVFFF